MITPYRDKKRLNESKENAIREKYRQRKRHKLQLIAQKKPQYSSLVPSEKRR